MNYDKPQNETEILSADEQKLREMCRSLKKTDAPADFDFKLKARIASAKPTDFKPRFGFAFRYALPALGLILVLGLLAFNGSLFSSGNNPSVALSPVAPQAAPPPAQTAAVSNVAPTLPEIDKPSESVASVSSTDAPRAPEKPQARFVAMQSSKRDPRKERKDAGGGSIDSGVRYEAPLLPQINANSSTPKNQSIERSNSITVKDVLTISGIDAELENGKWKVKSVTPNSVGESSDVRTNDIIESINDQPLSPATVFIKIVKGETVTVTRGGEKLQLRLRGKQ